MDGIRFCAFFAVFISHLFFFKIDLSGNIFERSLLHNGDLGVTLFFVLSGFLITYLLLQEKSDNGRIQIRDFYVRRILRIWPIYFMNIIIGVFIISRLAGSEFATSMNISEIMSLEKINLKSYFVFLGNFDFGSKVGQARNSFIGILWSVCVEEQFYLLWPLVISVLSRKQLNIFTILIVIFATFYRIILVKGDYGKVHYFTFSCMSDLAIGAFAANFVFKNKANSDRFVFAKKLQIASIYIAIFLFLILRQVKFEEIKINTVLSGFYPVIFSILFSLVLLEQIFSKNSFFKAGQSGHIDKFGKYTYFAYAFHYHIFLLTLFIAWVVAGNRIQNPGILLASCEVVVAYFFVFVFGKISYNFFEKPFMKMKSRFSYLVKSDEFRS